MRCLVYIAAVSVFCAMVLGYYNRERRLADDDVAYLRSQQNMTHRLATQFISRLDKTPRYQWTDLQKQGYKAAVNALKED